MRRFPVPALGPPGTELVLDVEVSHHLLRVVGIAPGEDVEVFDGSGTIARAVLRAVSDKQAVLLVTALLDRRDLAERHLVLGVVRPPAMDTVLRMGTELGLTHLWPVWTERTVRKGEDKQERWARIAQSAATQCGRGEVPHVSAPRPLDSVLAEMSVAQRYVGVPGEAARPVVAPTSAAFLVGPEGGLTPRELARAIEHGFVPVGLGPFTLRTETAAVAALAWLAR